MDTRRFTSPGKSASVPQQGGGLYVGTVSSVGANGLFVNIPGVASGFPFGPCPSIKNVNSEQIALTGNAQTIEAFQEYAVGDSVLCAFLENKLDQVVVIGKLA